MVATAPMPLNIELIVIAAGVLYVAGTLALQRKLVNPMRQQELQDKIKTISNELTAMLKANASKESIAEKQREVTPLMMESMKSSFKPMLVVLPLFFVVWIVVLPTALSSYANYTVNFIVPLHYKGLFFATSLILGLTASITFMIRDRHVHKKRKAMQQNNSK